MTFAAIRWKYRPINILQVPAELLSKQLLRPKTIGGWIFIYGTYEHYIMNKKTGQWYVSKNFI